MVVLQVVAHLAAVAEVRGEATVLRPVAAEAKAEAKEAPQLLSQVVLRPQAVADAQPGLPRRSIR